MGQPSELSSGTRVLLLLSLAVSAAVTWPTAVRLAARRYRQLQQLLDLLDDTGPGGQLVLIERDTLEGMQETIEVLSSPGLVDDLRAADEDLAAGRVSDGTELLDQLRHQYRQTA